MGIRSTSAPAGLLLVVAILVFAVPSRSPAEPFCSVQGSSGAGGRSECNRSLVCGLECTSPLCTEKRTLCDEGASPLVRNRARSHDYDYEDDDGGAVKGVLFGVSLSSTRGRLFYRDLGRNVIKGQCSIVAHGATDVAAAVCPTNTWVVGIECESDACEAFSLTCCGFSEADGTEGADGDEPPETLDGSEASD